MSPSKPRVGVTMGDPAGVGPEIIAKSYARVSRWCQPVIFGASPVMIKAFRSFAPRLSFPNLHFETSAYPPLKQLNYRKKDRSLMKRWGMASIISLEHAVTALLNGDIEALVTAPLCKEHLHAAGFPFPGHTEYLAHRSGTRQVRMMMAGPKLKVTLVTIHEPFQLVPQLISSSQILKTIEMTHAALKFFFGIERPKIGVAGLNPHAGESGLFGKEEKKYIAPAIRKAQQKKIAVSGPHPADTLFYRSLQGEFDGLVCMYHDQGLAPFKLLHFRDGVNITLGVPCIRTSVDHGTAFDIAWQGKADPTNIIAAFRTAVKMIHCSSSF